MKFLKSTCLVLQSFVLLTSSAAEPTSLPNIIYINADDLGVMDTGFAGRREYRTPNLDRLAAEGMQFTEAYAPAANCAPSRASCMSGLYAARHGVYTVGSSKRGQSKDRKWIPIENKPHLPDAVTTIAEALSAIGYKTIHLGKWHLGADPKTQGFDINIGGDASGGPGAESGYFAPFKNGPMQAFDGRYPKGTHRCDIYAEEAIRFMQVSGQQPFFMHMAYYSVHTPLMPVPGLAEKYTGIDGINAAYASMIEKMDESIGKIIAELDRLGLGENTLILFTSDNGGIRHISKQDPWRSGKGSYFEGGIRTPLLVRWPGKVREGSTCEVPVTGIDFFPTFLDAARADSPEGLVLDGLSLMPLLTEEGALEDRALYWHFPIYLQQYAGKKDDAHDSLFRTRPGSAMRFGKWKLHEYFEDGRLELYHLGTDPGERHNLSERMPKKAQWLHSMLLQWRAETGCPVPTRLNPEYQPRESLPVGVKG